MRIKECDNEKTRMRKDDQTQQKRYASFRQSESKRQAEREREGGDDKIRNSQIESGGQDARSKHQSRNRPE